MTKRLVLLGVGHTNAFILLKWRSRPLPGVELCCVSDHPSAAYSGMLPGTLAKLYRPEEMSIDLPRLCSAAGAELVLGQTCGLDLARRELQFAARPSVPFDVLSIGIGSVTRTDGVEIADDALLAIKPMQTFLDRLAARLERLSALAVLRHVRIAIVGTGAAGFEITCCLPPRLDPTLGNDRYELLLCDAGDDLLTESPSRARRVARKVLSSRSVELQLGRRIVAVDSEGLTLEGGERLAADLVIWAAGAAPSPLTRQLGLPCDERGFLLTKPTLQSTGDPNIFAVGDCGTIADDPTPKAGVYAVRQGPVLWANLERLFAGRAIVPYRPQRGFLKLLNTGDRRAIFIYRGLAAHGRWCWWLKDYIDRKFVTKYQVGTGS